MRLSAVSYTHLVEMVNDGDGQKAIDALNGAEFAKQVISVSVARPRSEKPSSGGYRDRRGGYNSSRRYYFLDI